MDRIYLDNAATTSMRPEAVDAMMRVLNERPYNPSSLHAEGRAARAELDRARSTVARVLECNRRCVIFTAGGSESDTLAILGVARASAPGGRHVLSTAIEHHAVLHSLDVLRDEAFDVTLLPVDGDGRVRPAEFEAALRDDTVLASVMLANNEIGTVQPIRELADIAHRRGVLLHCDAVQAPSWLDVRPEALGADLLSLSGHKFNGPKGTGVLYVRDGVAVAPLLYGGAQEYGRRAGTENVAGIAAFARALELAVEERAARSASVAALRDRFEAEILARIPGTRVNGAGAPRAAHISSLSFSGIESEALLARLDLEGVAASAGSACTSGALEPSHVLAALELGREWLTGIIRFSLGMKTTAGEIHRVVTILPGIVSQLRESVGSAA